MQDWPHQVYGVQEARKLLNQGVRRICVTSPTGGGKGLMMQRMIEWGRPTVAYINRTILFEQMTHRLDDAGHPFGVQASGYAPSIFENVQLAMIQTVHKRIKREQPHDAKLVMIDEWHAENSARSQEILKWHVDRGASVVGFTATPTGLANAADELIIAGTTSELRKCGALLPCRTFVGPEPSQGAYKSRQVKGLLQFGDGMREIMLPVIFGGVIEHYYRLNPDHRPTVLFAPGVEESIWFTEQFNQNGIPWSHIDSDRIILNGEAMEASKANRERLREASRTGLTKGISNRFVLRTGVDYPWLFYGIFACAFGSLTAFLQAGGRLLRNDSTLDGEVLLSDHGGNYWRHESLNCDRDWSLDDTDKSLKEAHDEAFRTKAKSEPIPCPKCGMVRRSGVQCPSCGFAYKGSKRRVIEMDGTLNEVHGDIYKPRRVSESPADHKIWCQCFFRSRNGGMTMSQARGLFFKTTGRVPGPDFPFVPKPGHEADWHRKTADVPFNHLFKGSPLPTVGDIVRDPTLFEGLEP